ncbi:MAG: hypothetical protein BWK73_04600 [Thiothrix lacustris]|uniref:Uncharacterized protein n=1 Tax=Thiothrix lacustris TaxID=525917 RepID=A0A1Y1QXL1_9GAMM|nr:MAG: hypothetical protein BWK73_04600 [Thiothrix lacustris]
MIEIRVDLREFEAMLRRLPSAEDLCAAAKQGLHDAAIRGVAELRDRDDMPRWTNNLADGIAATSTDDGAMIATHAPYAGWVHDGIQPGRFPNIDNLADWAKQHGLEGREWAIGKAIQQRGIRPRPFMRDYAHSDGFKTTLQRSVERAVTDALA